MTGTGGSAYFAWGSRQWYASGCRTAASIKSSTGAASPLQAGAHDVTAPPQVLLEMIADELTEQAIDKFTQDWQKMKKL